MEHKKSDLAKMAEKAMNEFSSEEDYPMENSHDGYAFNKLQAKVAAHGSKMKEA